MFSFHLPLGRGSVSVSDIISPLGCFLWRTLPSVSCSFPPWLLLTVRLQCLWLITPPFHLSDSPITVFFLLCLDPLGTPSPCVCVCLCIFVCVGVCVLGRGRSSSGSDLLRPCLDQLSRQAAAGHPAGLLVAVQVRQAQAVPAQHGPVRVHVLQLVLSCEGDRREGKREVWCLLLIQDRLCRGLQSNKLLFASGFSRTRSPSTLKLWEITGEQLVFLEQYTWNKVLEQSLHFKRKADAQSVFILLFCYLLSENILKIFSDNQWKG